MNTRTARRPRLNRQEASIPFKVLVARPGAACAIAPREVAREHEACWAEDGEILSPESSPSCPLDIAGGPWSLVGVRTGTRATWAVVEDRALGEVHSAVFENEELSARTAAHIYGRLREVGERIRDLPVGAVVGIFSTTREEYALYDRTPPPPAAVL
jgi:hypothetical protein